MGLSRHGAQHDHQDVARVCVPSASQRGVSTTQRASFCPFDKAQATIGLITDDFPSPMLSCIKKFSPPTDEAIISFATFACIGRMRKSSSISMSRQFGCFYGLHASFLLLLISFRTPGHSQTRQEQGVALLAGVLQ